MSQQTESTVVRLSQPAAGQTVVVPVDADNMRMALGFEPDPNAVAKNGQNLEFSFEDGGKLVLEGYYDHYANKTLPTMVTEGGDELPGEDFLASLREDLLTAAGPGAGAGAPGSGAGEYADDPGALIDGINRLGSLGTIYWDRQTEVPEAYSGAEEYPGGDGSFSVITDLGYSAEPIRAYVYEDARPTQHLHGTPAQGQDDGHYRYGQIQFTFVGTGTTTCQSVTITGLHAGTVIYFGDPNTGGVAAFTINYEGETIRIPYDQFQSGGVFVKPPADSDLDMTATTTLDISTATGNSATVPGPNLVVIVDAVADRPDMELDAAPGDLGAGMSLSERDGSGHDQKITDGWSRDDIHKDAAGSEIGVIETIRANFKTTTAFGDYDPADNSEIHTVFMQVPASENGGAWALDVDKFNADYAGTGVSLADPAVITLWIRIDPVTGEKAVAAEDPDDPDYTAQQYYQIDVPNDYLAGTGGTVELDVDFLSGDTIADTTVSVEIIAKAEETTRDSAANHEFDESNNVSYVFASDGTGDNKAPSFQVDTVDSRLTVRIGWMSEGGDNAKHVSGGYASGSGGFVDGDETPDHIDDDSFSDKGDRVPINFILSGTGDGKDTVGAAADEVITKVSLTVPEGSLFIDGTEYGYDSAANYPIGITVDGRPATLTVAESNGKLTFTITADDGDASTFDSFGRLIEGSIVYEPAINAANEYSHEDLAGAIEYEVSVTNPGYGSTAEFSGAGTVVVDAVADMPEDFGVAGTTYSVEGDEVAGASAAQPGGEANINGTVTFPDTGSGNERQFILLNVSDAVKNGWNMEGWDGSGASRMTQDDVYRLLKAIGGQNIPTDGLLHPVPGNAADQYLLFEVRETAAAGQYELVAVDAGGNATGLRYPVDYDPATGEITFRFPITAPEFDSGGNPIGNESATVWVKPIVVVEDPNPTGDAGKEYDYANNIATDTTQGTAIAVAGVTTSVGMELKPVFEGGEANKHGGDPFITEDPNAGRIKLAHDRTTDPNEVVREITFSYDGREGGIYVKFSQDDSPVELESGSRFVFEANADGYYTKVTVYDSDNNEIGVFDSTAPGNMGMEFEAMVNNVLQPTYVPKSGSVSDADVAIDIGVKIEDPASGYAPVRDDSGSVEVDAVADRPGAAYDQASYPDTGNSYPAARPGDTVELKGKVTFTDLDGSEDHFVMVQVPTNGDRLANVTIDAAGAENDITVTFSYGAQGVLAEVIINGTSYDPADVMNDTGAFLKIPVNSTVGSFDVSLAVQTDPANGSDAAPSIKVGGRAEETVDGRVQTDGKQSGAEPITTANNESETLADYTYTVRAAEGQLKLETGKVFEDGQANDHLPAGATSANQYWVNPNLGSGVVKISLATPDQNNNEYIAKLYVSYDDTNGDLMIGAVKVEPGTMFVFDQAGNCTGAFQYDDAAQEWVAVATPNVVRADFANGSMKYVPEDGTHSDTDVQLEVAAAIVEPDSGDVATSSTPGTSGTVLDGLKDGFESMDNSIADRGLAPASDTGRIVVDAVADRPDPGTVTQDDLVYTNVDAQGNVIPGEHEAAIPGGKVTIPVEAAFKDLDGSEKHYLVVQKLSGWNADVADTLTAQGKTYFQIDVTQGIQDYLDKLEGGYSGPWTDANGITYTASTAPDGSISVTAETSMTLTVPKTGFTDDKPVNIEVGGVARETVTDSAEEISFKNNDAVGTNPVPINVHVITTDLGIKMVTNNVYENGAPEWYAGDKTTGGYDHAGNSDFKEDDFDAGAIMSGAKLELTGLKDADETAEITFTIKGDSQDLPQGGDAGYMGRFVDAHGNDLGGFVWNDADGTWTCTITVTGTGAGTPQNIYFVPGENYKSGNLEFEWKATITETKTGQTTEQSQEPGDPALTVVVDAVAQAAELDGVGVNSSDNAGSGVDSGDPLWVGGDFTLDITATFRDFVDGSEQHFVLVEKSNDAAIDSEFAALLLSELEIDVNDSNNWVFTYDNDGDVDKIFYKLPVDDMLDNPAFADYVKILTGDGTDVQEIVVRVPMETGNGDGSQAFDITTGAMTVDTDADASSDPGNAQIGAYYDAEAGKWVTDDMSRSSENDTSIVFNPPVWIGVSKATGSATISVGAVYENDMANGHLGVVGDEAFRAENEKNGAAVAITLNLGNADAIVSEHNGDTVIWLTLEGSGSITYDGEPYTAGDSPIPIKVSDASGKWEVQGEIRYIPATDEETPVGDAYSDKDPVLSVSYEVRDGNSGDTATVDSRPTPVTMDAVAQRPDADFDPAHQPLTDADGEPVHAGDTVPVSVTVTFTDWDATTDHYILIEAKGGWQLCDKNGNVIECATVPGPDGKLYFQIPVEEASSLGLITFGGYDENTDSRTVTFDGHLKAPDIFIGSDIIDEKTVDGNMGAIGYGGMSRDRGIGDGEETYANNTAFDVDQSLKVDYGTGGVIPIVHAYENDRPLSYVGNEGHTQGGAAFTVNGNDGDSITFKYDSAAGTLYYNGDPVPRGGSVTLASGSGDGTEFRFIPKGHDDKDVPISWTGTGDVSGNVKVVIDAVAQMATGVDAKVNNNGYTAVVPGDTVTITVDAVIYDVDGSEDVFILVEQKPGWGAGVDTIYVDGKTYYKFPVDADAVRNATPVDKDDPSKGYKISVDVKLATPDTTPAADTSNDGLRDHTLETRVMTVDNATDGGEYMSQNNIAITDGKEVIINVSEVDTTVSVNMTGSIAEGGSINGSIAVTMGQHDQIVDVNGAALVITVAGGSGTLYINGDEVTLANGKYSLSATELDAKGWDLAKLEISYQPGEYVNEDVSISASLNVQDTMSGDAKTVVSRDTTEIDAIAQRPVPTEAMDDAAVRIGDTVAISFGATFKDVAAGAANSDGGFPEHHYLLLEVKANWGYGDKLEAIKDANGLVRGADGKMYYKIPVDSYIDDAIDAYNQGHSVTEFTFPENPGAGDIVYTVKLAVDGSGNVTGASVEAALDLTAPTADTGSDRENVFNYGGMAVDTPVDDSNESIANDVSVRPEGKLSITVGVVETAAIGMALTPVKEGGESKSVLTFCKPGEDTSASLQTELAANHETITRVEMTFKQPGVYPGTDVDSVIGTVTYDGQDYDVVVTSIDGGKTVATLSPALDLADGFEFGKNFTLTLADNYLNSNDISVSSSITVTDASGASGVISSEATVEVLPVSNEGAVTQLDDTDVEQADVIAGHKAVVSFDVEAAFEDKDTSEAQFILVQFVDGMINSKSYAIETISGVNYLKVPLANGNGTVEFEVTEALGENGDLSLDTLLMTKDGAADAWTGAADSVTISFDGVSFNLAPEAGAPGSDSHNVLRGDEWTGNLITLGGFTDPDGSGDTLAVVTVMIGSESVTVGGTPTTLDNGLVVTVHADGRCTIAGLAGVDLGELDTIGLTVTVKDQYDEGLSDEGTVTLNLTDANRAPVAVNTTIGHNIAETVSGVLDSLFTDAEGDIVRLTHVNGNLLTFDQFSGKSNEITTANGTLVLTEIFSGGAVTYSYEYTANPNAEHLGVVDTFTFAGKDAFGATTEADGTLKIEFTALDPVILDAGENADGAVFGWDTGVSVTGAGGNVIVGGDGNDTFTLNGAGSELDAGAGNDIINVYGSGHTVDGGAGNDTITGLGSGNYLFGGDGNDTIYAGTDDTVRGGLGDDVMYSGDGQTSFVWEVADISSTGLDRIMDFSCSDDKLFFDDLFEATGTFDLSQNRLTIEVAVDGGAATQKVEVSFSADDAAYKAFVDAYNDNAGSDRVQDALVQQLINSITGN